MRAALEVLHRAKVPVNDVNTELAGAFTVANAVIGWQLNEFLRVDNVGDKTYIGSVIVNDGNLRFYEPAPQRNIMLGVQASLMF